MALKKPWHEVIIDLWLMDPLLTQREIAAKLGKTEAWLSILINNDAFRAKYAERKGELVDPEIVAKVEERLSAVTNKASDELLRRLTIAPSSFTVKDLNQTVASTTRALGMGVAKAPAVQQTLYVIPAPTERHTVDSWKNRVVEEVIDVVDKKQA
jgi:hypothetical protein